MSSFDAKHQVIDIKKSGGITLPDSLFFSFSSFLFHVDQCNARIINTVNHAFCELTFLTFLIIFIDFIGIFGI